MAPNPRFPVTVVVTVPNRGKPHPLVVSSQHDLFLGSHFLTCRIDRTKLGQVKLQSINPTNMCLRGELHLCGIHCR